MDLGPRRVWHVTAGEVCLFSRCWYRLVARCLSTFGCCMVWVRQPECRLWGADVERAPWGDQGSGAAWRSGQGVWHHSLAVGAARDDALGVLEGIGLLGALAVGDRGMSAFVEDGFPVPRALELCVLGADRPDIRAIEEEGAGERPSTNRSVIPRVGRDPVHKCCVRGVVEHVDVRLGCPRGGRLPRVWWSRCLRVCC